LLRPLSMQMPAQQPRETLAQVNLVYELLQRPDPPPPRWSRRGVGLRLPVAIKSTARFGRATLLRLSTRGMLLVSTMRLREGDLLLVKLGRWGTDQFSFPCRVRRVHVHEDGALQIAVAFNGHPLRVRYPG